MDAQIVGTVTFSHSEPYETRESFRADEAAHRIRAGGHHDWSGDGEMHAWRVASVRPLASPVLVGSTGQTGFGPRSYDVSFLDSSRPEQCEEVAGQGRPRRRLRAKKSRHEEVDAEVAAGTSAEAAREEGPRAAEPSASAPYFEAQVGAWCGMHALNNYLGGPYAARDACRRAATRVVAALSQAGVGDSENMRNHLDPVTGFLSIDVINVLGAGNLGIHVEGDAIYWQNLQADPDGAALVNWNNRHWAVLKRESDSGVWVHINSILGDDQRHGRAICREPGDVESILAEIRQEVGGVALHRITGAIATARTRGGRRVRAAASAASVVGISDRGDGLDLQVA
jgi:hypothetical protein